LVRKTDKRNENRKTRSNNTGIVFELLICALGVWLFSLETGYTTTTYFFFGISLTGKVLAAIVMAWLCHIVF
jgi:hypothetical protein